ncbi:hypothetical protein JYU20_02975, partial [Bacteroidales bacterium AH-315-I05]|nr:hypothetical protein [Bacteroidales bacterium AH-315-I05]
MLSSVQAGEKNYVKLFDAIDRRKEYNEAEIKRYCRNEKFIKHFPSEKNQLYHLILKSLRGYHAQSSAKSKLQIEIQNIDILYKKALYNDCLKRIEKAKKLALQNEHFYYAFDLISREKRLLEEESVKDEFSKTLNDLFEEEEIVLDKLKNFVEYRKLFAKINSIFKQEGFTRNDKDLA